MTGFILILTSALSLGCGLNILYQFHKKPLNYIQGKHFKVTNCLEIWNYLVFLILDSFNKYKFWYWQAVWDHIDYRWLSQTWLTFLDPAIQYWYNSITSIWRLSFSCLICIWLCISSWKNNRLSLRMAEILRFSETKKQITD